MTKNISFKTYLTSNARDNFAGKLSSALESIHILINDIDNLKTKSAIDAAELIAFNLKAILKNNMFRSKEEKEYLKTIQKVVFAILKALDTNEELKPVLKASAQELQAILSKIGEPINSIAVEEKPKTPTQSNIVPPVD